MPELGRNMTEERKSRLRHQQWAAAVSAFCLLTVVSGCGETNHDRVEISRHTKELGKTVIANPGSKEGDAALSELISILNGEWSFASSQACHVLGDLGLSAAPAVPDLIRAANGKDSFVSANAVRALAELGPTAGPALELLTEIVELAVKNDHADSRSLNAVDALGNIGQPALNTAPLLERGCRSDNWSLAYNCKEALEKLNRSGKESQNDPNR
jgi:HEAT repeat protein